MKQRQSWKITAEFWDEVKQLIPVRQRSEEKEYERKAGGRRKHITTQNLVLVSQMESENTAVIYHEDPEAYVAEGLTAIAATNGPRKPYV